MASSESLLVLHDADDLACVEADCPEALSGCVLAFDTDVHLILEARGLAHCTPWDIVGAGELPDLVAFESAVQRHWAAHARIEFEGINLLGMAGYRHVSALARLTWAAYVIRRTLQCVQPTSVYTFDEPAAHGLDQPADSRKMPLLFALLRGLAERAGCSVRLIARHAPPPAGVDSHMVAATPAEAVRGPAAATGTEIREQNHTPADVDHVIGDQPFVLFHANRTDVARQLPLIRAILRQTDWQVVQLYKVADSDVLQQAASCGHHLWHESQVAAVGPVVEIAPAARGARTAFDAVGRAATDDLRALFDNRYVASHFDFLFGPYAQRMAGHVRAWKRFFSRRRPAVFVANYHAPIYDVAAHVGIPCLALPHGLMMIGQPEWFTTLPSSSLIGAFSELHRARLLEAGVCAEKVRVTGDPWVDQLAAEAKDRRLSDADRRAVRARLGIAPGRRMVLLCTASFGMPATNTTLPLVDWAHAVRIMRGLGELARRRPDWALVIKRHPRFDYPALYADINRTLPAGRRFIVPRGEPLALLAGAADTVCICNTPTSALIESSLLDKPVVMFSPSMIWYDDRTWGTDTWPHARSLDELEVELQCQFSSTCHYERRARQTTAAARRFVGNTRGGAIARCLEVLGEFVGGARRRGGCVDGGMTCPLRRAAPAVAGGAGAG